MVQPTPIPSTLVDPPHPPAFSCPSPEAKSASSAWYTRGKPSLQLPARMSGEAASKPSEWSKGVGAAPVNKERG